MFINVYVSVEEENKIEQKEQKMKKKEIDLCPFLFED